MPMRPMMDEFFLKNHVLGVCHGDHYWFNLIPDNWELETENLCSNLSSSTYCLCDLEEITWPLWVFILLLENQGAGRGGL